MGPDQGVQIPPLKHGLRNPTVFSSQGLEGFLKLNILCYESYEIQFISLEQVTRIEIDVKAGKKRQARVLGSS